MNINNDIYYKDPSGKRDVIPWVKSVNRDGTVTEYKATDTELTDAQLAAMSTKKMDCLDCHNRPSHKYPLPTDSLDHVLAAGLLDKSVPYVKREAIKVLTTVYGNEAEAMDKIRSGLMAFYEENYPELVKSDLKKIEGAVTVVQDVYKRTIFPEMKADWRSYPDHAGHLSSDGCFRCHDGLHQSADGKVITNDCNACHTILAQGTPSELVHARLQAQPFKHPVDVGLDVTDMKCSGCHNGLEAE